MQIGNSYLAKKSYAEAESAYQEVLKNDPADANGLLAMGLLREAQGNAADAAAGTKGRSRRSDWTRPLMKLAELARAAGDRATASRHLTRVIDGCRLHDGQQADGATSSAAFRRTVVSPRESRTRPVDLQISTLADLPERLVDQPFVVFPGDVLPDQLGRDRH